VTDCLDVVPIGSSLTSRFSRARPLAEKREVTAEYVPTADQRALVENAAAFGITQADIAEQLKIDECVRLQRPEQRIGLGIA
jgi:hypothetical protein